MRDVLYLAWRYLLYHRGKTATLVGSVAIIAFLPAGLDVLVDESALELTARASATPLVVGARGSRLELVLNSLYFDRQAPDRTPWSELERVAGSGLAAPIPLNVRSRVGAHPIVGTELDYLDFRGLRIDRGRAMATLGECMLGAGAAESLGVGPGDSVVSAPETVFDLAGVYPLRMRVVGVLERAHSSDDDAVFVDVKTSWIIQGLAHGHRDLASPGAGSDVLARDEISITANASVREFTEITAANLDRFHLHGDPSEHPLTGVIAVPHDEKSRVLLLGRYSGPDERYQIVEPDRVVGDLLGTVFTIRSYVLAAMITVAVATLATVALVFMLSLRLRRREIDTLAKIGFSRVRVAGLLVAEVVVVLALAGGLAGALTWIAREYGAAAIRTFLLS